MKGGWKRGDSALERVDDDVVRLILSFCELQTIVSYSQASKHSHSLVFSSKEIWLTAARRLHSRGYLDIAPEHQLAQLSLDQLIFLIKRIAAPSDDSQTQVLPPKTLSFSIPDNEPPFDHTNTLVFKCGDYVLLADPFLPGAKLWCWSTKTKSAVWSSRDEQPSLVGDAVKIVKFTARIAGPERLDILICLRDPAMPFPNDFEATYKVKLWRLNLANKAVEVVDLLEYEPEPGTELYANEPELEADCKLCLYDDYAVAYGVNQLLIYNQSSKTSMRFHTATGEGNDADECEDEEWGNEDGIGGAMDEVRSLHIFEGLLLLGLRKANQGPFRTLIWDLRAVTTQQNSQYSMLIDEVESIHSFDTVAGSDTMPQFACYPSPYTDDVLHLDVTITRHAQTRTHDIQRHRLALLQLGKVSVERLGSFSHATSVYTSMEHFSPEKRSFSGVKNGTWPDDFPSLKGDVLMEGASIAYRNPYNRTVVYVKERKVTVVYYG